MLGLRTIGRRSGKERTVILGYFEDGPDLVTMAMNGWADPEPAWWLNLQAHPDVTVDLPGGSRPVHAHAADKDERPRLWARWASYDKDLDAFAGRRSNEIRSAIMPPSRRVGRRHLPGNVPIGNRLRDSARVVRAVKNRNARTQQWPNLATLRSTP